MVNFSIYELAGMLGLVTYLLPFALEKSNRINTPQYCYSLFNLTGASCYLISLASSPAPGVFAASTLWVIFCMLGIIGLLSLRQRYTGQNRLANASTLVC